MNFLIIHQALEKESGKITFCHNFTPQMFCVKDNEWQKVTLTKTLFSTTITKTIGHITGIQWY